jgi:hypothetical protein
MQPADHRVWTLRPWRVTTAQSGAAFLDALTLVSRRIDLLLALPVEKLERLALGARMQAIGEVGLASAGQWPEG